MDRSLDDVISERQREKFWGRRDRRQYNAPRDGVRKSQRDEPRNLDRDWVHDRYDDDLDQDDRRPMRNYRATRARRSPEADLTQPGAKIRVDNLHYDLTEDDLRGLFTRIGPVSNVSLLYDRQDRSRGIAFVTYINQRDAEDAIDEFNGANAKGQPIKLTLLPTPKPRNPFDFVERPGKSLFDRVEPRRRSASPEDETSSRPRGGRGGPRYSDVSKPPPEHIDRYVPGQDSRRRDPPRRDNSNNNNNRGLRPGQRRERERSSRVDPDGHMMVQGRPRKTQEELDAEMADYWNKGASNEGSGGAATAADGANGAGAANGAEDDVDMIE